VKLRQAQLLSFLVRIFLLGSLELRSCEAWLLGFFVRRNVLLGLLEQEKPRSCVRLGFTASFPRKNVEVGTANLCRRKWTFITTTQPNRFLHNRYGWGWFHTKGPVL